MTVSFLGGAPFLSVLLRHNLIYSVSGWICCRIKSNLKACFALVFRFPRRQIADDEILDGQIDDV
jgi:hypothetical protein